MFDLLYPPCYSSSLLLCEAQCIVVLKDEYRAKSTVYLLINLFSFTYQVIQLEVT